MIKATMRSAQILNGVVARSASLLLQRQKPTTWPLVPRVGGTFLQRKMYGSYSGLFSQPALPTDPVIKYANDVKEDVEKAAKRQLKEYIPVLFSQQNNLFPGVLEETEYHVKVQTGNDQYVQVRVAADLEIAPPQKGELETEVRFNGLLDHRTREDPIRPYQLLPGGFTDVLLPTSDVIYKTEELQETVEKALGENFAVFKAVLFRSQLVEGTNYLVKVHTGGDTYLHMMMYEGIPFPSPVKLVSHQYPKKKEDPLVIFPSK